MQEKKNSLYLIKVRVKFNYKKKKNKKINNYEIILFHNFLGMKIVYFENS